MLHKDTVIYFRKHHKSNNTLVNGEDEISLTCRSYMDTQIEKSSINLGAFFSMLNDKQDLTELEKISMELEKINPQDVNKMMFKMKFEQEKIKSENITHEEHMNEVLQDEEYQKMYLNSAIQEFITDGDYDLFFQSLEQVVKARMSISELSQRTGITRAALYEMFKGERVPRLDTIGKLLKELGYSLQVA